MASIILTTDECNAIVKSVLETDNFRVTNVCITDISEVSGLMAKHLSLTISVMNSDSVQNNVKLFVKMVPQKNDFNASCVQETNNFFKEVGFYSHILEKLTRHTRMLATVPRLFYCRKDMIVMEDLSIKDFCCLDKSVCLDFLHCANVLKSLACYHSATLIIEERKTISSGEQYRLYDTFKEYFVEDSFTSMDSHPSKRMHVCGCEAIAALVNLSKKYGIGTKYCGIIQDRIIGVLYQIFNMLKKSDNHRNVVCHGDLWSNNILFKNDANGHPCDVRLVDFQLIRYMPPAHDIMFFLHLTTTRSMRKQYLDSLLSIYYEALKNELDYCALDIKEILPWTEFLDYCKEAHKQALIMAALIHHVVLLDNESMLSVTSSPKLYETFMLKDRCREVCDAYKRDSTYHNRLNDDLEELIETFIIEM